MYTVLCILFLLGVAVTCWCWRTVPGQASATDMALAWMMPRQVAEEPTGDIAQIPDAKLARELMRLGFIAFGSVVSAEFGTRQALFRSPDQAVLVGVTFQSPRARFSLGVPKVVLSCESCFARGPWVATVRGRFVPRELFPPTLEVEFSPMDSSLEALLGRHHRRLERLRRESSDRLVTFTELSHLLSGREHLWSALDRHEPLRYWSPIKAAG